MSETEKVAGGGLIALLGELVRAGLTDEMAEAVLKDPKLARKMVGALAADAVVVAANSYPALVHGLFAPVADQIAQLKRRNAERGWGFTDAEFAAAEAEAMDTVWPENRLTAVAVVPYLDTVQATFDELWLWAASRQEKSWRWDELESDEKYLRLLDGNDGHRRGLKVEAIDLGADCGSKPEDVRDPDDSPHAGVLAAAALHPEWVRRMDGADIPYVWLAGYECTVPGGFRWQGVPCLNFHRAYRRVGLYAHDCACAYDDWAVPAPGK